MHRKKSMRAGPHRSVPNKARQACHESSPKLQARRTSAASSTPTAQWKWRWGKAKLAALVIILACGVLARTCFVFAHSPDSPDSPDSHDSQDSPDNHGSLEADIDANGEVVLADAKSGEVLDGNGGKHQHEHVHDHGHDHEHGHNHEHGHDHEHVHDHDHDHDHHDVHDHEQDHDHDAGHEGGHGHSHGGGHGHSHGGGSAYLSEDEKHPWTAIFLTTLSGLAAGLGGLIVICMGVPSDTLLGHLLSFAAGIMLYVSYADLLPHATGAPPHGIGFFAANCWMFGGMLLFALMVTFVPEPNLIEFEGAESGGHGHSHGGGPAKKESKQADGDAPASPSGPNVDAAKKASTNRLMMTGIIAALGISLHNFPEGLVVYNATIGGVCAATDEPLTLSQMASKCMGRGLIITWAIALHNIPEGMAVASPIYSATKSKWQTMKWCILSSICEPFAAVTFGMFFNSYLTYYLMAALNAAVAGIMIMLCFVELIPASIQLVSPRAAVFSNLVGQILMFFSLHKMYEAGVH